MNGRAKKYPNPLLPRFRSPYGGPRWALAAATFELGSRFHSLTHRALKRSRQLAELASPPSFLGPFPSHLLKTKLKIVMHLQTTNKPTFAHSKWHKRNWGSKLPLSSSWKSSSWRSNFFKPQNLAYRIVHQGKSRLHSYHILAYIKAMYWSTFWGFGDRHVLLDHGVCIPNFHHFGSHRTQW